MFLNNADVRRDYANKEFNYLLIKKVDQRSMFEIGLTHCMHCGWQSVDWPCGYGFITCRKQEQRTVFFHLQQTNKKKLT